DGAARVGHALPALLGGLLGVAAPAIPLAGVYVSGVLLVGRREKRRWPQVLAAVVLLVATCVLVQIGLGTPGLHPRNPPGGALGVAGSAGRGRPLPQLGAEPPGLHPRNPPGGALGVAVSAWLVDLFNVLGTIIVVSAVAFAAMLV